MSRILPVSLGEFETLLYYAQQNHHSKDEPIPALSPDNRERLISCLQTPFQTFDGHYLYSGFLGKAAILFYLLIKNHPLQNGNKRMAILTLYYFFHKNKHTNATVHITDQQLYDLACNTAKSTDQEDAMRNILRTIKPPKRRIS
jgi:death-on-curing protein